MSVRPDMAAASPSTSPFFTPKVQRGRPRKRGGLSCARANESRRRGSYISGMMPASSELSHSIKPSNLLHGNVEVPDTPGTWDTALSAPEFHEDASDPNAMHMNHEATGGNGTFLKFSLRVLRSDCL